MKSLFKFVFTPVGAILTPLALSFTAWVLPSFTGVSKGFPAGVGFDATAWGMVVVWYMLALVGAWFGFALGRQIAPKLGRNVLVDNAVFAPKYIWFLNTVAWLGTVSALYLIVSQLGVSGILSSLEDSQANNLKEALYSDYSIGFASLRYVSILASGVSLGDFLVTRRFRLMHAVGLLSVLVVATVASRLSLVWATTIGLGLYYTYGGPKRRLRLGYIVGGGIVIFAALSWYNFVRNGNTYEHFGVSSPVLANVAEIHRYLAAPFQGGLSSGQNLTAVMDGADPWVLSGIDYSLTTNSAMWTMLPAFGLWAFPVLLVTCLIGGGVMGFAISRNGSIVYLSYFVLWYCFAELWRGNIFFAGINITLIVFTVGVAFFGQKVFRRAARAPAVNRPEATMRPGPGRVRPR